MAKQHIVLPTHVSFRSPVLNGSFLCSCIVDRWYNYHMFQSGLDVADPRVAHELFPTNDGYYRIKDLHFGKFWRRSPNWIWADAADDDFSNDTKFSFVKLDDNVVAIRNLGNNNFCGPLTTEGKTNCLNARYPNITAEARLIVEECVLKRIISDVKYRLNSSKIYDKNIIEVDCAFAENDDPVNKSTITLKFSVSDSRTTTWKNSVSVKVGVKVNFKAAVPFIADGKVEVSNEYGYAHEWGATTTNTTQREMSYTVQVPPSTKMKVVLMCSKAKCDVPFSYTKTDLLPNGRWVTTYKDDGIYKGINSYNFDVRSSKI